MELEKIKEAINYIQANLSRISINAKYKEHDYYNQLMTKKQCYQYLADDLYGVKRLRLCSRAVNREQNYQTCRNYERRY